MRVFLSRFVSPGSAGSAPSAHATALRRSCFRYTPQHNKERPSVDSWREQWHKFIGTIEQMNLNLPSYSEDKQFIDSILSAGKYAISHSPEYREAYHPHYRIVERNIFEREIKPKIERLPASQ